MSPGIGSSPDFSGETVWRQSLVVVKTVDLEVFKDRWRQSLLGNCAIRSTR